MANDDINVKKHLIEHEILGVDKKFLKLDTSNDPLTGELVSNYGATFNEGGNDSDFRVEGREFEHLLYLDAGSNAIGINTGSLDNASIATFVGTAAKRPVIYKRYVDSAASAGTQVMVKGRGTEAAPGSVVDGDLLGGFLAQGISNNLTEENSSQISMSVDGTVSGTSIPGMIDFKTIADGGTNLTTKLTIANDGIVINENSADFDLRAEGATITDLFNIDAGNDKVAVGTPSDPFSIFEAGGSRVTASNKELVGMRALPIQQGSGNINGMAFGALVSNTNTAAIQQIAGFRNSPHNQGSGNVGIMIGGDIRTVQNNVASTIGSNIGMRIRSPDLRLGSIDNNCGLFIGNHSGIGDVTNYAIKSQGGDVLIENGDIRTDGVFNVSGNDGWTGTFTNGDAATVTVSGGIIISVV